MANDTKTAYVKIETDLASFNKTVNNIDKVVSKIEYLEKVIQRLRKANRIDIATKINDTQMIAYFKKFTDYINQAKKQYESLISLINSTQIKMNTSSNTNATFGSVGVSFRISKSVASNANQLIEALTRLNVLMKENTSLGLSNAIAMDRVAQSQLTAARAALQNANVKRNESGARLDNINSLYAESEQLQGVNEEYTKIVDTEGALIGGNEKLKKSNEDVAKSADTVSNMWKAINQNLKDYYNDLTNYFRNNKDTLANYGLNYDSIMDATHNIDVDKLNKEVEHIEDLDEQYQQFDKKLEDSIKNQLVGEQEVNEELQNIIDSIKQIYYLADGFTPISDAITVGSVESRLNELKKSIKSLSVGEVNEKLMSPKFEATKKEINVLTAILEKVKPNVDKANKAFSGMAEGSLQQLRIQLKELNKEFDSLSREDRNGEIGEGLKKQIQGITAEISSAEQATGRFQRNVGNYQSAFQGFSMATQQILREVPSTLGNFQMFMLAISNNLPILGDQYSKLSKYQNEILNGLHAQYKETGELTEEMKLQAKQWGLTEKNIESGRKGLAKMRLLGKQLLSTIFSWQTALLAIIVILQKWQDIMNWLKRTFGKIKLEIYKIRENLANIDITKKIIDNTTSINEQVRVLVDKLKTVNSKSEDWRKITAKIEELTGLNLKNIAQTPEAIKKATDAWIDQQIEIEKNKEILNKLGEDAKNNAYISLLTQQKTPDEILAAGEAIFAGDEAGLKLTQAYVDAYKKRFKVIEEGAQIKISERYNRATGTSTDVFLTPEDAKRKEKNAYNEWINYITKKFQTLSKNAVEILKEQLGVQFTKELEDTLKSGGGEGEGSSSLTTRTAKEIEDEWEKYYDNLLQIKLSYIQAVKDSGLALMKIEEENNKRMMEKMKKEWEDYNKLYTEATNDKEKDAYLSKMKRVESDMMLANIKYNEAKDKIIDERNQQLKALYSQNELDKAKAEAEKIEDPIEKSKAEFRIRSTELLKDYNNEIEKINKQKEIVEEAFKQATITENEKIQILNDLNSQAILQETSYLQKMESENRKLQLQLGSITAENWKDSVDEFVNNAIYSIATKRLVLEEEICKIQDMIFNGDYGSYASLENANKAIENLKNGLSQLDEMSQKVTDTVFDSVVNIVDSISNVANALNSIYEEQYNNALKTSEQIAQQKEQYAELTSKQRADARSAAERQYNATMVGILASQATGLAQITVNGLKSYASVADIPMIGALLGKIVMASTIASGIAQLTSGIIEAKQAASSMREKTQYLATGGYVRGAGTSTSDSIPARLSNGEYVVNAEATARNRRLLDRINNTNNQLVSDYKMTYLAMADAVRNIQPVVSVKEITKVQTKVIAKEQQIKI